MDAEDAHALHARDPTACSVAAVELPHTVQPAEASTLLAHLQDKGSGAWRSMFV